MHLSHFVCALLFDKCVRQVTVFTGDVAIVSASARVVEV